MYTAACICEDSKVDSMIWVLQHRFRLRILTSGRQGRFQHGAAKAAWRER